MLITCTVEICIQQLGRVEEMVIAARYSYASVVLGIVILSVRPSVWLSHACFLTNPKNLLAIFFYTTWKGNPSSQMWFFVQLCSSWQDLNWLKGSRGLSAAAELLVWFWCQCWDDLQPLPCVDVTQAPFTSVMRSVRSTEQVFKDSQSRNCRNYWYQFHLRALTLLVRHLQEPPACKTSSDEALAWLCGPVDASVTPLSLAWFSVSSDSFPRLWKIGR